MSRILIGTTIPAFAMTEYGDWHWWLENSDGIERHAREHGDEVDWLAVCQTDARGREPFAPLVKRLGLIGYNAEAWWFSVDTGGERITTPTRLAGICIGRNLIIERALREGHDWIYFADSDVEAPDDILPRLLEVGWPVVGGHVPTYCLDGDRRPDLPGDCREHWNSAGSLLVHRDVFRRVPWRHDPDVGLTDDPATQTEMAENGWPTVVRHDVICHHHPDRIGALEHRGLDLAVYR